MSKNKFYGSVEDHDIILINKITGDIIPTAYEKGNSSINAEKIGFRDENGNIEMREFDARDFHIVDLDKNITNTDIKTCLQNGRGSEALELIVQQAYGVSLRDVYNYDSYDNTDYKIKDNYYSLIDSLRSIDSKISKEINDELKGQPAYIPIYANELYNLLEYSKDELGVDVQRDIAIYKNMSNHKLDFEEAFVKYKLDKEVTDIFEQKTAIESKISSTYFELESLKQRFDGGERTIGGEEAGSKVLFFKSHSREATLIPSYVVPLIMRVVGRFGGEDNYENIKYKYPFGASPKRMEFLKNNIEYFKRLKLEIRENVEKRELLKLEIEQGNSDYKQLLVESDTNKIELSKIKSEMDDLENKKIEIEKSIDKNNELNEKQKLDIQKLESEFKNTENKYKDFKEKQEQLDTKIESKAINDGRERVKRDPTDHQNKIEVYKKTLEPFNEKLKALEEEKSRKKNPKKIEMIERKIEGLKEYYKFYIDGLEKVESDYELAQRLENQETQDGNENLSTIEKIGDGEASDKMTAKIETMPIEDSDNITNEDSEPIEKVDNPEELDKDIKDFNDENEVEEKNSEEDEENFDSNNFEYDGNDEFVTNFDLINENYHNELSDNEYIDLTSQFEPLNENEFSSFLEDFNNADYEFQKPEELSKKQIFQENKAELKNHLTDTYQIEFSKGDSISELKRLVSIAGNGHRLENFSPNGTLAIEKITSNKIDFTEVQNKNEFSNFSIEANPKNYSLNVIRFEHSNVSFALSEKLLDARISDSKMEKNLENGVLNFFVDKFNSSDIDLIIIGDGDEKKIYDLKENINEQKNDYTNDKIEIANALIEILGVENANDKINDLNEKFETQEDFIIDNIETDIENNEMFAHENEIVDNEIDDNEIDDINYDQNNDEIEYKINEFDFVE